MNGRFGDGNRIHFQVAVNGLWKSGRTLSLWEKFCLLVALTLLVDCEVHGAKIEKNSGLYCYARCLASCVDDIGAALLDSECKNRCQKYNSTSVCPPNNADCYKTCNNLIPNGGNGPRPETPQNVTVAYTRSPQPTPHEADLRWPASKDATLYIVQAADLDSFNSWQDTKVTIQVSTYYHFIKSDLCPQYGFRVASLNRYDVSEFSEVVNLTAPVPIVPGAAYSVASADLINTPFVDVAIGDKPVDNTTVRLVLSFAPPPNWNLADEITTINANLHVVSCNRNGAYSPLMRRVKDRPQFEVLLPGLVAEQQSVCIFLFSVQEIYTKCNARQPYPYPEGVYDPKTHAILPEFTFRMNCQNIRNSVCPYRAISTFPSCGVEPPVVQDNVDNSSDTTFGNVSVRFDKLLSPRDATILYYIVRYGEVQENDSQKQPFVVANMSRIISNFTIDNTTKEFRLSNLDTRKPYAFQICAIYDESTIDDINWAISSRYIIDWRHLEPGSSRGPHKNEQKTEDAHSGKYVAMIALPLLAILCAALTISVVLLLRYKRRTKSIEQFKRRLGEEAVDDGRYVVLGPKIDKWEIPRKSLLIYENQKLGAGAFGAVYKCKLIGKFPSRDSNQSVLGEEWTRAESGEAAAKLLPEYADDAAKSAFRQEINLMKQLGWHERLVNMLGCCTVDEPLCLVVEYCEDGDLLHYLRDRRRYMIELEDTNIDLNNLKETDHVDLAMVLCFKDLLSFAWQISVGLEYLTQKGFIHRDVAARNVLVDRGKKAKIGDFGLCRYSYDETVYIGHGGRLPIKWMAPEAIRNYEFTTKSDVWSFGVLLFEIITMGGNPYPSVQPADVEKFLACGNRMDQPDNCPAELYEVMMTCWHDTPQKRPSFAQLREGLRLLLEQVTVDYYYLNLSQNRDYYNVVDYSQSQQASSYKFSFAQNNNNTKKSSVASLKSEASEQSAANTETCSSPPATVGPANDQLRDSISSEQLLITPTSPFKFKFFKFKPGTGALDSLPEGSSPSGDHAATEATGQKDTGRACDNLGYMEDFLSNSPTGQVR